MVPSRAREPRARLARYAIYAIRAHSGRDGARGLDDERSDPSALRERVAVLALLARTTHATQSSLLLLTWLDGKCD